MKYWCYFWMFFKHFAEQNKMYECCLSILLNKKNVAFYMLVPVTTYDLSTMTGDPLTSKFFTCSYHCQLLCLLITLVRYYKCNYFQLHLSLHSTNRLIWLTAVLIFLTYSILIKTPEENRQMHFHGIEYFYSFQ